LVDVAPGFIHPVLHLTMQQLYDNIRTPRKYFPFRTTPHLKRVLPANKKIFDLRAKTYIMGILNVTPDSFSDGGRYLGLKEALARADELISQGADIIDIGGQSSKPGTPSISAEEELGRVLPVLKGLRQQRPDVTISIDTFYSKVAEEAVAAGANMINDVSGGLHDPEMFQVAAKLHVPIVVMHAKPTPQYELQQKGEDVTTANYDVIAEIISHFKTQVAAAAKAGVNQWQLILDPGLGFSKIYDQSIEIIRRAKELTTLGYPILIGPSRKGFVGHIVKESNPQGAARMWGTMACCCAAVGAGVCFVRVHDVAECKAVLCTADAIYKG